MQPPPDRIPGQEEETKRDRAGERPGRHCRLAEAPGQQQVRDEDQRHELDAGGDADARALPPPPVRLAGIPHDQCQQDQVDLAEIERALDRLGPEQYGREQQSATCPSGQRPPALPAGPLADDATEREPDRRNQRHDVDRDGGSHQNRSWGNRQGGE